MYKHKHQVIQKHNKVQTQTVGNPERYKHKPHGDPNTSTQSYGNTKTHSFAKIINSGWPQTHKQYNQGIQWVYALLYAKKKIKSLKLQLRNEKF